MFLINMLEAKEVFPWSLSLAESSVIPSDRKRQGPGMLLWTLLCVVYINIHSEMYSMTVQ